MKWQILVQQLLPLLLLLACDSQALTTHDQQPRRKTLTSLGRLMSFLVVADAAHARNLPQTATRSSQTPLTLLPILQLTDAAKTIEEYLVKQNDVDLNRLQQQSTVIPVDEKSFKAIFDVYSDPVSYKQKFVDQNAFLVYYTKGFDGPGRPSIEQDLPVKQTLQYGARNEAWVAWDAFQAEVEFQRKDTNEKDKDELLRYIRQLIAADERYLMQTDPSDMKKARQLLLVPSDDYR